ncbi:hypothetical protein U1Q18_004722 [Sarracenia purpurea var. burkii]
MEGLNMKDHTIEGEKECVEETKNIRKKPYPRLKIGALSCPSSAGEAEGRGKGGGKRKPDEGIKGGDPREGSKDTHILPEATRGRRRKRRARWEGREPL